MLPLATSCTFSSSETKRVRLTVTISDCPLSDGLFDARYGLVSEAEVHAQMVRRSGDRVLSQSLTTGQLFDVKFLTFSTCCTSTGRPLPTYTSLSVVESHIDLSSSVLRDNWENALATLGNTTTNRAREILCPEGYEYELDSDFEDENEAPSGSSSERDPVLLDGQHPNSGTEMSCNSSSSLSVVIQSPPARDEDSVDNQLEELIKGAREPPPDNEQTVWVKFAAQRTWRAFLWYCYTGDLVFGELRSQVKPGGQHLREIPLEGGPPTCSPKSMYRLADLLGNKDLKAKALVAIKERMTEENVLDEAFSVFTSRYPDVRKVQIDALMRHCESPKVKEAFLKAMEKYGSMPHAKPVLSAFFDHLVA